ncbi:MAG: choice-of-anchor D domain-containing protein [Acidobacteriota bacterium]|nr:choice-of-anchor D domain-containing protein [Acidobacteriota bacterium]
MRKLTVCLLLLVVTASLHAQLILRVATPTRLQTVKQSISLSPSSLSFSAQNVNTTSTAKKVTLLNSSTKSLTISSITAPANFGQTNNCPSTLAASASCTISVTFAPTKAGSLKGSLLVADSATGSPQAVALSGNGVASTASVATAKLSATSLSFASQLANTTSAAMGVNLSNSGSAALTITGITITGSFTQTNTCGTSLAAGGSCAISVTFKPTAAGSYSGTLSVADSATGSPQSVTLSGAAVTAAKLSASPSSVAFGSVNVGQTSSKSVTLSNTGGSSVTISAVSVSGAGVGVSGLTTPLTLAASASAAFTVSLAPSAAGSISGTVTLTNNSATTSFQIPVTGTGVATAAASLSPSSLTFSSLSLNTTSAAQSVTLTNSGSGTLTISSITASGDFAQSNTCGASLAAGASCNIAVTFTPISSGTLTGTLTVTDNASGSPQSAALTGTGTATAEVQVTWDASVSVVSGYNTYRGTVTGGPYTKLTSTPVSATTYIDATVQSGTTYYYVVTAIGTDSLESSYSNQTTAVVP